MWRLVEMHPVRGKKVMIQSVLLCCKDFFQACGYTPGMQQAAWKNCNSHAFFPLSLSPPPLSYSPLFLLFSLLKIIRLQSGLRGVTFLLTFLWYKSELKQKKPKNPGCAVPEISTCAPLNTPPSRLFPWCCFNVEFHKAQRTLADLILPWHSSSVKSS